jgi:cardiolipin synthase A/B
MSKSTTAKSEIRDNSVRLFGRLLGAGIEIQEFNRTMLHYKTMVVDHRWVTLGTTNFDNRSFAHNEESNVCVFDRALAGQLRGIFLDDLAGCERDP